MQSLRLLALVAGATGVVWAAPAAADDWALETPRMRRGSFCFSRQ